MAPYLERVAGAGARGWREAQGVRRRHQPGIYQAAAPAPVHRLPEAAVDARAPSRAEPAAVEEPHARDAAGEVDEPSVARTRPAPKAPRARRPAMPRSPTTRSRARREAAAGAEPPEASQASVESDARPTGRRETQSGPYEAEVDRPTAYIPTKKAIASTAAAPPGEGPPPLTEDVPVPAAGSAEPARRHTVFSHDEYTADPHDERTAVAHDERVERRSPPATKRAQAFRHDAGTLQGRTTVSEAEPVLPSAAQPASTRQRERGRTGGETKPAGRATIVIGRMDVQVIHQPPARRQRQPAAAPVREMPDLHHMGRFRLIP